MFFVSLQRLKRDARTEKISLGNRINKALLSLLKVNDIPDSGKVLNFRYHMSPMQLSGTQTLTSGFTFLY